MTRATARSSDSRQKSPRASELPFRLDWPEPLHPQQFVVTLLGAYVRPRPRRVWSGGLVELLEEFGFSTGAARAALGRLVRRGLLSRVREGRHVYYELTPKVAKLLSEGDRRIFTFGRSQPSPAEVWTILWHVVPADRILERTQLARRLRFLGFGSIHDGAWVSPHDREDEVTALVEELAIEKFATVLLARPVASLEFPDQLSRAWDLDALVHRYRRFLSEFEPYLDTIGKRTVSDREAFWVRTRLAHIFRTFPFLDPELPADMMGDNRLRKRASETFHALYTELGEAAQQYFDRIAGAGECRSLQSVNAEEGASYG
jgi:phenylacetic acid degradation operon negative regulatory protein